MECTQGRADIFSVESEIAKTIADTLQARLAQFADDLGADESFPASARMKLETDLPEMPISR